MEITEEYLDKNGYEERPVYPSMLNLKEWISKDRQVIISHGISNHPSREWSVHVDNEDFQTIGSLDVQDVEMLEKFLEMTGYKKAPKIPHEPYL